MLRILGPLQLRDAAGAEVGLGGMRSRRLLAGLAVHAGEIVAADRLMDVVWGAFPPASAKQNLHTYLWSLRRTLAAAADGQLAIETKTFGYRLYAGPGMLDWESFRDLSAAATGFLSGDPAKAGELLRRALDLWRGPAAADVADGPPALAARIAAMEESRMTALEQRIEADLAAGQHRMLIAELAELVAEYPLREQVHAYQMIALYRCNRQAEALAAFHRLRHDLAEELGVDPSPALGTLYEAMLRADPVVAWPQPPAPEEPRGRPDLRILLPQPGGPAAGQAGAADPPADAPLELRMLSLGQRAAVEEERCYQGRAAELSRVLEMLTARDTLPRVVQLHGPPGIGKTAFVYALARSCKAQGWPAVILDSRDFQHDAATLSEEIERRTAGLWTPSSALPLLLVLDTAEEMQDMEHGLWNVVLPRLTGPILVMLSGRRPTPVLARSGQWRGLVDELELPELTAAESERLVRVHGADDADAISKVLSFARGNPLFLVLAAQHAQSVGQPELELSGMVARPLIGHMTRDISQPGMRRLLEAASLVRTFNQELLAAMVGCDVSGAFDALCGLSVVRSVQHGARLHDLVRESIAADLQWRSPRACQDMRRRAYTYLSGQARSSPDAALYVQELLHLAADSAVRAKFYAPAEHPDVHVRPATPDDLPRLTELCHVGVTRFGLPGDERARQLQADFPVVRRQCAVALNDAGAITGFAYTLRLNADTLHVAAKTRERFFATLPESELADIKSAPLTASRMFLVAGATHLPGYDHVGPALREALFPKVRDRHMLAERFVAYHLLTPDCLELPEIIAAGHTRRRQNIDMSGYQVDEWLLRFGDGGFLGWIGEVLGATPDATADL